MNLENAHEILNQLVDGEYNNIDANDKKILTEAIDIYAKNGKHRNLPKWNKEVYGNKTPTIDLDRFDDYILAFCNYWYKRRGFLYSPVHIKAMLGPETTFGTGKGQNGTIDIMQGFFAKDPNVYMLARVKPNPNPYDIKYDPLDSLATGDNQELVPKNGFKAMKKLFDVTGKEDIKDILTDTGTYFPERVTIELSFCFSIFILGNKTNFIRTKAANENEKDTYYLEAAIKSYNSANQKEGNKVYVERIFSLLQWKNRINMDISSPLENDPSKPKENIYKIECRVANSTKDLIVLPDLPTSENVSGLTIKDKRFWRTYEVTDDTKIKINANDEASLIQNIKVEDQHYVTGREYAIKDKNGKEYIYSDKIQEGAGGELDYDINAMKDKTVILYFKPKNEVMIGHSNSVCYTEVSIIQTTRIERKKYGWEGDIITVKERMKSYSYNPNDLKYPIMFNNCQYNYAEKAYNKNPNLLELRFSKTKENTIFLIWLIDPEYEN